jgi:hypothetical protein
LSDTKFEDALNEAQRLGDMSDERLYEELGLRMQDIYNADGYQRSQAFSAEFEEVADDMLSLGDLRKIGQRWMRNIEDKVMELLCTEKNEELKQITEGKTIPQIAATLATTAVISVFAPPAWLIVAVTILAAKVAEAGLDALCETWRESKANDD